MGERGGTPGHARTHRLDTRRAAGELLQHPEQRRSLCPPIHPVGGEKCSRVGAHGGPSDRRQAWVTVGQGQPLGALPMGGCGAHWRQPGSGVGRA